MAKSAIDEKLQVCEEVISVPSFEPVNTMVSGAVARTDEAVIPGRAQRPEKGYHLLAPFMVLVL